MTDQEVLISTLREARRIIGEYTGPRNANQTLTQLVAVLDSPSGSPLGQWDRRHVSQCPNDRGREVTAYQGF